MLADRVAISSSENLERVIEDLMQAIGAPRQESRSAAPVVDQEKAERLSPSVVIQAWWKKGVLGSDWSRL